MDKIEFGQNLLDFLEANGIPVKFPVQAVDISCEAEEIPIVTISYALIDLEDKTTNWKEIIENDGYAD